MRHRLRCYARTGLTVLAAALLLAGCDSAAPAEDGNPNDPSGGGTPFSSLAGTWTGTWTDTRYNVSGSLQATFTVNGSSVGGTGTIGLQSLGLGNETGTATGLVVGDGLAFTFASNTVGTGSGALATGGSGGGVGSVTGVLNLGEFSFGGTVTATTISGTFTFLSPTGGNGVASLTRQ